MTATRWKREGKKGGPANMLDGRWEVQRAAGWWYLYDRQRREACRGLYRTAADAREAAERRAARAGSERWT